MHDVTVGVISVFCTEQNNEWITVWDDSLFPSHIKDSFKNERIVHKRPITRNHSHKTSHFSLSLSLRFFSPLKHFHTPSSFKFESYAGFCSSVVTRGLERVRCSYRLFSDNPGSTGAACVRTRPSLPPACSRSRTGWSVDLRNDQDSAWTSPRLQSTQTLGGVTQLAVGTSK